MEMDDHTFFLVREADDQIHRAALLIEQHRLHIMTLHPSRRRCEEIKLKSLMSDYPGFSTTGAHSPLSHLTI